MLKLREDNLSGFHLYPDQPFDRFRASKTFNPMISILYSSEMSMEGYLNSRTVKQPVMKRKAAWNL